MGGKPQGINDRWPQDKLDWIEKWKEENRENPNVLFYDDYKFPNVNPVNYKVKLVPSEPNSEDLHIQNYMYPAACGNKDPSYKGVILFVHGFSDYGGLWAHVGEMFSNEGFDFFMMDSRGHGESGG